MKDEFYQIRKKWFQLDLLLALFSSRNFKKKKRKINDQRERKKRKR